MLYRSKHAEYCEYQIQLLYFVFQPALCCCCCCFFFLLLVSQSSETVESQLIIDLLINHQGVLRSLSLTARVRQSQSRPSVSGRHIERRLAPSVAGGDCLCMCARVFRHPGFIYLSGGSRRPQRKAGTAEPGPGAYLPFAGWAATAPFSTLLLWLLPRSQTHTHT